MGRRVVTPIGSLDPIRSSKVPMGSTGTSCGFNGNESDIPICFGQVLRLLIAFAFHVRRPECCADLSLSWAAGPCRIECRTHSPGCAEFRSRREFFRRLWNSEVSATEDGTPTADTALGTIRPHCVGFGCSGDCGRGCWRRLSLGSVVVCFKPLCYLLIFPGNVQHLFFQWHRRRRHRPLARHRPNHWTCPIPFGPAVCRTSPPAVNACVRADWWPFPQKPSTAWAVTH